MPWVFLIIISLYLVILVQILKIKPLNASIFSFIFALLTSLSLIFQNISVTTVLTFCVNIFSHNISVLLYMAFALASSLALIIYTSVHFPLKRYLIRKL